MALNLAKEAFQTATVDPSRLLLPLVLPAGATAAGVACAQVPSAAANALSPPLHLLPGGQLTRNRTAFHAPDGTPWNARSHAFPAAWPRTLPTGTSPPGQPVPPAGLSKRASTEAWHNMLPSVASAAQAVPPLTEAARAQVIRERILSEEQQLWSVVQRIVPVQSSKSVSEAADAQHVNLVLTHATGLHKETFEPFLASLLAKLPSNIIVDSIWCLDTLNQGESASLNREGLGAGLAFWPDLARDVIHFIKYYLPTTHPGETVGDVLPRTEKVDTPRTVLIGHSLGACVAGMVANTHPELIDTLILMDPPLLHPPVYSVEGLTPLLGPDGTEVPRGSAIPDDPFLAASQQSPMSVTAKRRDAWPSRMAAATLLDKTPFYRDWSPVARDLFMEKALVALPREDGSMPSREQETDETPVGLSTSKYSEAATFGGMWSATHIALSLLSGSFARYWAQRAGSNTRQGHTFVAYAPQFPFYGLMSPYFERMRVVSPESHTSLEQQRQQGERLRSDLIHNRISSVPTDTIVGWPELLARFSVKGEAALFSDSAHMLPQIQPENVATVVAGWLQESISS